MVWITLWIVWIVCINGKLLFDRVETCVTRMFRSSGKGRIIDFLLDSWYNSSVSRERILLGVNFSWTDY